MKIRKVLEQLQPIAVLEYDASITLQKYRRALTYAIMTDRSYDMKGIKYELSKTDQTDEDSDTWLTLALDLIEKTDPTANKEYMIWLVKTYSAGGWGCQIEDLYSKIKPALIKFHKLKQQKKLAIEHRDILKYKDFKAFINAIDAYPDPAMKDTEVNRGEYSEVYNTDQVRIIWAKDKTAAIYYGQGTKWCTAATSGHNYFDSYDDDGPLYILLPKQPEHPGEKYQMHFETDSYMDEQDEPVPQRQLLTIRFGDLLPWARMYALDIADEVQYHSFNEVSDLFAKVRTAILQYTKSIELENGNQRDQVQTIVQDITDYGPDTFIEDYERASSEQTWQIHNPLRVTQIPEAFAKRISGFSQAYRSFNNGTLYDTVANWIDDNIEVVWQDDHYEVKVSQRWWNK